MNSRSLWITIGFLLFLVFGGPFRLVAFFHDIGLYPSVTEAQVVAEMNRRSNVQAVTCQAGSMGWDFVCDFEVQARGGPAVRHREGIRTSLSTAVARAVRMPVNGPILTEEQALQWQKDELKAQAGFRLRPDAAAAEERALQWQKDEQEARALLRERPDPAALVNVRTATIAELVRIPRVNQFRAKVIHAAVRRGLVRKLDDLLKIDGIDRGTLNVMRTRAYWE